jgi:hypothetical protein
MVGMDKLQRGQIDDDHVPERYHDIVRPHVESFDYFIGEGMRKVTDNLQPARVRSRRKHSVGHRASRSNMQALKRNQLMLMVSMGLHLGILAIVITRLDEHGWRHHHAS